MVIVLAIESKFKFNTPLSYVLEQIKKISENAVASLLQEHNKWWENYWNKSSISVEDTVLMKAYHQGLYTVAFCSRNAGFPREYLVRQLPLPAWNGDYHLNYYFQAQFYGLYAGNRIRRF